MDKVLDKSWKKLLVALVVFLFVGVAARQGLTADKAGAESGHKAHHETTRKAARSAEAKKPKTKNPAAGPLTNCGESVEEISEAYNECTHEGCSCGTWTHP